MTRRNCSSNRDRRAENEEGRGRSRMKKARSQRSRLQMPQCNAASLFLLVLLGAQVVAQSESSSSGLRYEPESNAYTGLTFTFDPRLDKRIESLHSEYWLSIMQQTSAMLYETLNGRAYLPEVRVLIPYKWRSFEWLGLPKPGSPIIMNRRLRYSDSDVLVGFEDPVYKETPYAIQHDECTKQGLHIHMPISFLEQNQLDSRLKARLLLREFASHRFGIFKESGFRYDYMYPIFPSLPGLLAPGARKSHSNFGKSVANTLSSSMSLALSNHLESEQHNQTAATNQEQLAFTLRGFDHNWNECSFDTDPSTGLPTAHALTCAPYLTKAPPNNQISSFNLMSADLFSYANLSSQLRYQQQSAASKPLEWRQLGPDSVKWHFCGENFPSSPASSSALNEQQQVSNKLLQTLAQVQVNYAHNQRASNKQNEICNERSAMDVIRSSEDFRQQFRPSNFNRLPDTNFKFLQEMPPRLVLCVEYTAHLYQAKRREYGILEAAIGKFLAYDLIADSEMALVLFGLEKGSSVRTTFKKLDSSVDSRLTLYSPNLDPYEDPAQFFSEQELAQLEIQPSTGQEERPAPLKGTCSFERAIAEANAALANRKSYEDVGADLVMVTSGLFIETNAKLEEILRFYPAIRADSVQLNIIIYPSAMLLDSSQISGFNATEADKIIQYRVNKLLLIQRITGAKIHLIREQLDPNGNVRMSTLLQFHQVFEHLARGHSWEQTDSIMTLNQKFSVDSNRTFEGSAGISGNGSSFVTRGQEQYKFTYQFEVDESIQEELIVGFVEPKQTSSHGSSQMPSSTRTGKRFTLKQLQLHSPGGQLVLQSEVSASDVTSMLETQLGGDNTEGTGDDNLDRNQLETNAGTLEPSVTFETIHTLFPYRAQLNLAGFHLRSHQLAPLKATSRLAGLWTLTATADEPLQAGAISMAKVSPSGDTLSANCWIQTYSQQSADSHFLNDPQVLTDHHQQQHLTSGTLKNVKVFVQVRGAAQVAVPEVNSRLEVEDELGSIVQNSMMLDDGLGTPDITRGDGIHSQYVRRAQRSGFYRVRVEISAPEIKHAMSTPFAESAGIGQDQPCCGSFMGSSPNQRRDSTRHVSRLVYCGTFYLERNNKLEQRPARPANFSVVGVDQDRRRVSLRWFESVGQLEPIAMSQTQTDGLQINDLNAESEGTDQQIAEQRFSEGRALLLSGTRTGADSLIGGRYEVKLFNDRDALRRAFDAKPEVGFRFNQSHVEGPLPNSNSLTGQRDLTLRIPSVREGIYFIAIRIHHLQSGLSSTVSRPAHFWLRAGPLTHQVGNFNGDLNDLLGLSGNSLDLEDPSGSYELQQRGLSQFLPRAGPLDGASLLILVSLMALLFSLLCISLIACLAGSRRSLGSRLAGKQQQRKDGTAKQVASSSSAAAIMSHTGSGSSSVASSRNDSTSNCGASELNSSMSSAGSQCGGNQLVGEPSLGGKMSLVEELGYPLELGPPQTQARGVNLIDRRPIQEQQHQQIDGSDNWLQHTLVNGYAYATVAPNQLQQKQQQQQLPVELNQDGLSVVQSWPANILLSHYDKVKQARERNEAPPVMRVENLEGKQYTTGCIDGLGIPPPLLDAQSNLSEYNSDQHMSEQQQKHQSYLLRQQQRQPPGYFNLQLQQQLNSVLRHRGPNQNGKEQGLNCNELLVGSSPNGSVSPALEGVLELRADNITDQQSQLQYSRLPNGSEQPPQYVYCTTNSSNSALQSPLEQSRNQSTLHTMISEPSIYSQVTNLQQVTSQQQQQNYYANQWQSNNNNNNIYSQAPQYSQYYQQQQQLNQREDYHPIETSEQQMVNPAISEV